MKIKSTLLGIVGAALITTTMLSGASAANSADVSVRVSAPDNGVLSASITGARFQEVKYRAGDSFQNSVGDFVVTATDTRGVGSGWVVTIAGKGDFTDQNGSGNAIKLSALSLQAGTVQGADAYSKVNGIATGAVAAMSQSEQAIMKAEKGAGVGTFTNGIKGTIAVPDGTLVGTYQTTLTVTIAASN